MSREERIPHVVTMIMNAQARQAKLAIDGLTEELTRAAVERRS